MKRHPLVQSLINAYENHDYIEFSRICALVEQRLSGAAAKPQDSSTCARGAACMCIAPRARELCSHRIAKPEGGKL